MVGPEDQKESTPIGRKIDLSIPDENQRIGAILMSQFKAEAVGFHLNVAGEQIEKRQNGKPKEEEQEDHQWKRRRVAKFGEAPAGGEAADGGAAEAVGEPKSGQEEGGDDGEGLP